MTLWKPGDFLWFLKREHLNQVRADADLQANSHRVDLSLIAMLGHVYV